MFKTSRLTFTLGTLAMALFQNCSGDAGFEAHQSSTLPVPVDIRQDSADDDHWLRPEIKKTTYSPILVDRQYLSSLLVDIFGPKAVATDSTKLIYNHQEFGGPCSMYEDHAGADRFDRCQRNSVPMLLTKVNPPPSVTRQILMARACSDLTTNDTTIAFALKRISPTSPVPNPSPENIKKMIRLFYREKPVPHTGLVESLQMIFTPGAPTLNDWRVAMHSVCASNHWQVL